MAIEKISAFLKQNPPFFYATNSDDGARLRPFGFFMEFEGKFYFGMGKHKESFKQTVKYPNVELCAYNAAERKWMRVRGTAVLDERPEVMDKVFEVSPGLKNLYNEKTGNVLGNFYLKNGYAEIMDMKGYFEKFTF